MMGTASPSIGLGNKTRRLMGVIAGIDRITEAKVTDQDFDRRSGPIRLTQFHFVEQFHKHVAVARLGLAVAAQPLAGQLWQGGQEIRSAKKMSLIQLDDLLAASISADLERVSPFRWPGNQHVVPFMAEVDNASHVMPPEARLVLGIGSSWRAMLSDAGLCHPHVEAKGD